MPLRFYFLLLMPGLGALPLVWGASESRSSDLVREVVARGPRGKAKVVFKSTRTSKGSKNSNKTTTYWVDLTVGDRPLSRQVDEAAWSSVEPGQETDWYEDPAFPEGFAALEIGRRTDNHVMPYLIGFFMVFLIRAAYRKFLPKAANVRESHGSPVDAAEPRLPPPPRERTEAVDAFSRARLPSFFPLALSTAGLAAGLAGLFAERGFWGAALLQAGQGAGALLALLTAAAGLRVREAALWRDGVEAPGLCSVDWTRGFTTRYQAEFAFGGRTWHLEQEVMKECPRIAEQRMPVSVLVDPRNPKKAMLAPIPLPALATDPPGT